MSILPSHTITSIVPKYHNECAKHRLIGPLDGFELVIHVQLLHRLLIVLFEVELTWCEHSLSLREVFQLVLTFDELLQAHKADQNEEHRWQTRSEEGASLNPLPIKGHLSYNQRLANVSSI